MAPKLNPPAKPTKKGSDPVVTFSHSEPPTLRRRANATAVVYQTVWQLYDSLDDVTRLEYLELGELLKLLRDHPEDKKMLLAFAEFLASRRAPRQKEHGERGDKK